MSSDTAPASAVTERRLPRASIPLARQGPTGLTFTADEVGGDRLFEGVIIREGVFMPGLGNPEGDRIFFDRDFLKRLAPTGEGKRVDLDHSRALEDEVGVMQQLRMDADEERLRAALVLQRKRPRFMDAIGFVEGRLQAKQVPNLSIEIINLVMRPATTPEEKAKWDFAMIDATLDGIAILAQGACSDKDGCGIGLAAKQAGFTVLALQGSDNKEATTMCDQKELVASLQAKVKALEDADTQKTAALTATKTELAAVTTARDTLKAAADEREREDREDLTTALKEALPTGTDIKAIVGENPTTQALAVALKALQHAPKPAAPAKGGVSLGRATIAGRPAPAQGADRAARLLALRRNVGLPEKSGLPASMQRNTDALLATAAEAAPAE